MSETEFGNNHEITGIGGRRRDAAMNFLASFRSEQVLSQLIAEPDPQSDKAQKLVDKRQRDYEKGIITEEMAYVAARENCTPEFVREELAAELAAVLSKGTVFAVLAGRAAGCFGKLPGGRTALQADLDLPLLVGGALGVEVEHRSPVLFVDDGEIALNAGRERRCRRASPSFGGRPFSQACTPLASSRRLRPSPRRASSPAR